jgi:hypothetical protein
MFCRLDGISLTNEQDRCALPQREIDLAPGLTQNPGY